MSDASFSDRLLPSRESVEGKRVLLAEDDSELRSLLASVLRADGFEVLEAQDGHELMAAVERLASGQLEVHLIVSDVWMRGNTGLNALRRLRQLGSTLKMVLITAFGDPKLHQDARSLGAHAVLDKPFDLDDLRMAVWNGAR